MNAKLVVALILTLQVSLSLCDIPAPSQELVDKYNEMKSTFIRRILNFYSKLQAAAAPHLESLGDTEKGQKVKDFVESLQTNPEFQALVQQFSSALSEELPTSIDKARNTALGWYEQCLRPHIGQQLNDAINGIKTYLDIYLPAE